MTNDIVASGESSGQLGRSLEVVLDQVVGDPDSGADNRFLRELGPAERRWAQCRAVTWKIASKPKLKSEWGKQWVCTVARCNVVDDGTLVAVGPGVPFKLDSVSSFGVGIQLARSCALVAVYI